MSFPLVLWARADCRAWGHLGSSGWDWRTASLTGLTFFPVAERQAPLRGLSSSLLTPSTDRFCHRRLQYRGLRPPERVKLVLFLVGLRGERGRQKSGGYGFHGLGIVTVTQTTTPFIGMPRRGKVSCAIQGDSRPPICRDREARGAAEGWLGVIR